MACRQTAALASARLEKVQSTMYDLECSPVRSILRRHPNTSNKAHCERKRVNELRDINPRPFPPSVNHMKLGVSFPPLADWTVTFNHAGAFISTAALSPNCSGN